MAENTRPFMSRPEPPKAATWLLKKICTEELTEEILGDLYEAYHADLRNWGTFRAKVNYCSSALGFFKPGFMEKFSHAKQYLPMFKNYFLIATRNLLKRKGFTFLNLAGLAAGLTAVLLIFLYTVQELSYDNFVADSEHTYRIIYNYREQAYNTLKFNDYYGSTPAVQQRMMNYLADREEVADACQFVPAASPIGTYRSYFLTAGDREITATDILFTNTPEAFARMFRPEIITGSKEAAFTGQDKLILTTSLAEKLIGDNYREVLAGAPLTVRFNDKSYQVNTVVKDPPANSHFGYEAILTDAAIPSWAAYTYVQLKPGEEPGAFLETLNQGVETVFPGYWEDELSRPLALQPLREIHLADNQHLYEIKPTARYSVLILFMAISAVILLIIWTNYANMSVARYAGRQKEMGVRKVMGAAGKDISLQILTESLLTTLLALPLVFLSVHFLMPFFNELMQTSLSLTSLFSLPSLGFLLLVVLATTLISGFYPALLFSRRTLTALMKAGLHHKPGRYGLNLRTVLLGVQLFFLTGLISLSIFMNRQMQYIAEKDPGFDTDYVVTFPVNGVKSYRQITTAVQDKPGILAVGTGMVPGNDLYNQLTYKLRGTDQTLTDGTLIETHYSALELLDIACKPCNNWITGRDSIMILNQTAARRLSTAAGLEDPGQLVGKTVVLEPEFQNEEHGNGLPYLISGIIPDFDYFNLKTPVQPLLMRVDRKVNWTYNAIVKISPRKVGNSLEILQNAYREAIPDRPFTYTFLDDRMEEMYSRDESAGVLASVLTGLSLLLALMGLVAVIGYMTYSRRREISVKKVFGASSVHILAELNRPFVYIMAAVTLLVTPLVIFTADSWLSRFSYRISPDVTVVLCCSLLVFLLVVFIVAVQSLKTIRRNPAEVLRED